MKVKKYSKVFDVSEVRAEMISRTESARSQNAGRFIAYKTSGEKGKRKYDDIDNDDDFDVVSASGDGMTSGAIYWFEHPNGSPRDGSWTRHRVDNVSWNYGGLIIEDVDGDGYKDILCNHAHHTPGACGYPDTASVMWFKNPKGSGRWTEYSIGKQAYPHTASLIDVDGDGVNELWVPDASFNPGDCNYGQYSGGLVYFKKGADPTQPWEKYRVAKAPAVGRQGAVYDIDGDGDLDVAISSDHEGNHNISLVWWENKTDRSTPSPVISSPARSAVFKTCNQASQAKYVQSGKQTSSSIHTPYVISTITTYIR